MKNFFCNKKGQEEKKKRKNDAHKKKTAMENDRLFELCKQGDLEGLKEIIDKDPSIDVKKTNRPGKRPRSFNLILFLPIFKI